MKVLLVDDESKFATMLAKRLALRGIDIEPVFTGEDAIAKAKTQRYNVAILDVKMPGMDGIETLRKIKSAHPLIEVVMLTAHATVESAIEGMKFGAFDYLMKPCDMDQLIGKVNEAARKKQGHEEKIKEARVKEIISKRGF